MTQMKKGVRIINCARGGLVSKKRSRLHLMPGMWRGLP